MKVLFLDPVSKTPKPIELTVRQILENPKGIIGEHVMMAHMEATRATVAMCEALHESLTEVEQVVDEIHALLKKISEASEKENGSA